MEMQAHVCYDINFHSKNDFRVHVDTLFRAESMFLIINALQSNQKYEFLSEKEDDINKASSYAVVAGHHVDASVEGRKFDQDT
ncbi:hypothetical protein KQX54_016101 [Cotesia glomerata]|uniref:Uncharacterized protein n=1 Tax=Cotesia glomerata TaxID=32391 RepID=A0AAV7J863_COTGL|nr:hypothetical protein KQX54_016101 [Cotesia glomerata]